MRSLLCISVLSVLVAGIAAAPACLVDGACKGKLPFQKVDCWEQLKFKHPKAACFMNDADEFLILALNEEHIAKRSIADYETYLSPAGGKAVIHRIKRNANADDELNFNAEVLSAKDLRKLLNKDNEVPTESPTLSNEVATTATTDQATNTDTDAENKSPMGVIIFIGLNRHDDNDIEAENDTSLSGNDEQEMAEALIGLLLLGAILEEIKKHQIDASKEDD